jgi:SAM-dependent methyltransferase
VSWAEAQSFDRVAEDLDRLAELSRNELISSWLADVLPKAGRYAIDLGCGPGRQAVLLAGRFGQVDAVDLSGPMIELARARRPRRLAQWLVPLRPRLHAMAGLGLAANLVRRGPRTAWEIYRLSTRREWLDHRVSDRFFTRDELVRCCDTLLPGYRLDVLGGPRGLGLVWDLSS